MSNESVDIPIEDEVERVRLEGDATDNGEVVDEEELVLKVVILPTPVVVVHNGNVDVDDAGLIEDINTPIAENENEAEKSQIVDVLAENENTKAKLEKDAIDDDDLIDDINKPIKENTRTATLSSDEGSDFDDDDFDDFEQASINGNAEDDDNDFGDFDEFSQEEQTGNDIKFAEDVFDDDERFNKYLSTTMDEIFPDTDQQYPPISPELLNERSSQIYTEISRIPRLKPPNWTRLQISHNLLIKLGIPINLDDLNDAAPEVDTTIKRARRKSNLQPQDIDWTDFKVPEFADLSINPEQKLRMLNDTNGRLSKIETDILNNTSKKFLEDTTSDDIVSEKLAQFHAHYTELIQLSSVWNNHLQDLQKNFEIYESVVQSTIGYSQKLRRDEILEDLKKLSKSKQKKKLRL